MEKKSIDVQIAEAQEKRNQLDVQNQDEKIRAIGSDLIHKHIGALKELAK